MTASAIRLGNTLIDTVEAMSDELAPKVMNRDLDLIEEAIDDEDMETLQLFEKFLGYNWRPENQYVTLVDIQRVSDELYDHGIRNAEELVTVARLNAFHTASTKLVRFGYKKWSDAAILSMLHPEEVPLITALVIDRGVEGWGALERALIAVKGLDAGKVKDAA
jgi:hypothetical protein